MNNLVKNESRAEEDLIEIIHSVPYHAGMLCFMLSSPPIILTVPQAGVNVRHLGYLRRRVNEKHQRDILIEVRA
jgi:hypothetical protein